LIPGLDNFDSNRFFGFMLGFIIGTTFHEFMHAYTAYRLGDTTAQQQGRITLNPAAHFDPFGFFMMILLALGAPLLAWGKPVPVNPYALRGGRRGMALVAVAGPISNLVFAIVLLPLYNFTGAGGLAGSTQVHAIVGYMLQVNLLLFTFNLIPIPPLDGFNIMVGILPNRWTMILEPIRAYSVQVLLLAVFILPLIGNQIGVNLNVVGDILNPIFGLLQRAFFSA